MENGNHTRGAWETLPIHNSEGAFGIYAESEQAFIAVTVDGPAQAENARLIAAAPELLAALRQCLPLVDAYRRLSLGDGDMAAATAWRAITLATGATDA
jgi:hypothetical protein